MGSGTALSKSAPPSLRNDLLSRALLERRSQLRSSWTELVPAGYLQSLGPLAGEVAAFLSSSDVDRKPPLPERFTWLTCEADFWACLQAIALGRVVACRTEPTPPAYVPASELRALSSAERFELLRVRYRCPWNIGAPSEFAIADEILRRLMVNDRAMIEKGAGFDVDGALLALNLVGIRALVGGDLRSFDALNYFYELPRRLLVRMKESPRLLTFWLCIYKQVLSTADWPACALP